MRRTTRAKGSTPSFPALRDDLIAATVKGEAHDNSAPAEPQKSVAGLLPGIDPKAISNLAPDFGTHHRWRSFEDYYESDIWKQRKKRRGILANWQCSVDGCTRRDVQVHHNVYNERWGTGRELDSELDPLCSLHHGAADEARREAARRYTQAAYNDAVETGRGNRDFHRWMCRHHGRDYEDDLGGAGVAEAREEYERSME